ncbi:MAG: putative RiPP precursor [Chloroflexi bacterium]|nr:putative RiPP precursor [Chloroflexota bacterium]
MAKKTVYLTPEVKALGDVRTLTQRNVSGTKIDKAFPAGTPINQMTFSS